MASAGRLKILKPWVVVPLCLLALAGGTGLFLYSRSRPHHLVLHQRGALHLRGGNWEDALESFQAALDENPDFQQARLSMVHALAQGRQFQKAHDQLDAAAEKGLKKSEEALLRANLHLMRAGYRLQSAGDTVSPELCDSLVEEDLDPAIELVKGCLEEAENRAFALTRLGDVYMQKSRVLGRKWRLLRKAWKLAQALERQEDAQKNRTAGARAMQQMATAQRNGILAYGRAIEADPQMEEPRLALAGHLLSLFAPRPTAAKSTIEPVIETKPEHTRARTLLAQAERLQGNYDAALEHLRSVREEDHDSFSVLYLKTEILVEAERWDEAVPVARQLIENSPQHPRAAYLRGRTLIHEEKYEEAATRLQNALGRTEEPWPQARFALAEALRQAGRREQAITAYRRALSDISETTVSGLRMRAQLQQIRYEANLALARELEEEQPESAAEHATSALMVRPDRTDAFQTATRLLAKTDAPPQQRENLVLLHAGAFAQKGNLDEAISVCDRAISNSEDAIRIRHLRARLLVRSGDFTEAVRAYRELGRSTGRPGFRLEEAGLHRRLGQQDEALAIYRELLEDDGINIPALTGLVGLRLRRDETEEALALLEKAEADLGSDTVRSLLINLYVREGQSEKAIELARSLAAARPDSPAAHVVVGQLLWRAGSTGEARAEFDRALEIEPAYLPAYKRGMVDLEEGNVSEAISLFTRAREQFPRHPAPTLYLAVALQADGRMEEAISLLEENQGQQGTGWVSWFLAVMHAAGGDTEQVRQADLSFVSSVLGLPDDRLRLLEKLAELEPPRREKAAYLLNLSVALRRHGNVQAALKAAEELEELMPNEPVLASRRLSLLDGQGDHQAAVEGLKSLIRENPGFLFARIKLADSYVGHDELDAAVQVLVEAVEHAEEDERPVIHLHLAGLYERQNLFDKAMASYRIAMQFRPTAPLAYNNLAWLQITRKNDPEAALPLAQEALRLGGPRPEILDTVGWIHYLRSDVDEAIRHLEPARKAQPQTPTIRYHLGAAYLRAERNEEAREELEEALAISTTFPEAEETRKLLQSL